MLWYAHASTGIWRDYSETKRARQHAAMVRALPHRKHVSPTDNMFMTLVRRYLEHARDYVLHLDAATASSNSGNMSSGNVRSPDVGVAHNDGAASAASTAPSSPARNTLLLNRCVALRVSQALAVSHVRHASECAYLKHAVHSLQFNQERLRCR